MLDVLIGVVLVFLGFAAGRKYHPTAPGLPAPEERERQQLTEDRTAFSQLMGYSADRAYGLFDEE